LVAVGAEVGLLVATAVGSGAVVSDTVGLTVGLAVGLIVGLAVGASVAEGVASSVGVGMGVIKITLCEFPSPSGIGEMIFWLFTKKNPKTAITTIPMMINGRKFRFSSYIIFIITENTKGYKSEQKLRGKTKPAYLFWTF